MRVITNWKSFLRDKCIGLNEIDCLIKCGDDDESCLLCSGPLIFGEVKECRETVWKEIERLDALRLKEKTE